MRFMIIHINIFYIQQSSCYQLQINKQFKICQMKKGATTQFDYPTSQAQVYKNYNPQKTSLQAQSQQQKQRYKDFLKQQQEIQRKNAKQEQQRKKQQQRIQSKQKIQNQLSDKKKQLEQLERIKKQALQEQKRSYQLAVIKQEQNQIKKLQNEQKMKQNVENANLRFTQALKRLEEQNNERDFKKTQAQYRRKVVEQTQKFERDKAIQYKQYIQQKERNIEVQVKRGFDEYKHSLGRVAYNKNVDYTKTCLHNPKIIIPNRQQTLNAIQSAQITEQIRRQASLKKRQQSDDLARKSIQRGRQALLKIQRQRQYQQYCLEAQQKSKNYNFRRIEAGKSNNFVGIKPETLEQMQHNKKLRSEQQFEKMFLNNKNIQWVGMPATKHQIFQGRNKQFTVIPNGTISNIRQKGESQIACISQGQYSFQSEGVEDLTSVKKVKLDRNQQRQNYVVHEDHESEEESPRNLSRKPMQNVHIQNSESDLVKKNQQVPTDKIKIIHEKKPHKYKIPHEPIQLQSAKNKSQNQKQQQMSNLCKNKKGAQDLNYSQSEDSFV